MSDVGLYSKAGLDLALSDTFITLLENIFGTSACLTQISFRRKVELMEAMPWHSDHGSGVIIAIYMNDVDLSKGVTCLIPKTHLIGTSMNGGYLQVPPELISAYEETIFYPEGGAGSVLIFDQSLWHARTPVKEIGREIFWCSYDSVELMQEHALRIRVSSSFMAGLSERQKALIIPKSGDSNKDSETFSVTSSLAEKKKVENIINELTVNELVKYLVKRIFKATLKPLKRTLRAIIPRKVKFAKKKHGKNPLRIRSR